ncbi:4930447F04Rik [Phodopus roborovskii]|uniref:4930447F04Rik protein n=1 Tax=Phodopus roborovskii TaxID=109678 RepID=A0AAU9YYE3_PHORO|nr:4930447F04Rik [Phodopus roborovskii]
MTKVTRKSLKQNRAMVTLTPRTKGRKKRKTCIPLRCRLHFKVPKTRMKTKRSLGSAKKKFQTYNVHPKKRKRPMRPTIYVCYHMLSRKWKERKERKRNKRRFQSKKKSQAKRRCNCKKQKNETHI